MTVTSTTKQPKNFEDWYRQTDAYKQQVQKHIRELDDQLSSLWENLQAIEDSQSAELAALDQAVSDAEAVMVEARQKLQEVTNVRSKAVMARQDRSNQIDSSKSLLNRQIQQTLTDLSEAKSRL